jgi:DNA modification methylase
MREMDAGSVDTIVTDPPFFMPAEHYQSRKDWGGRRYSDISILKIFWDNILQEATRVLKPTGHLFVFCNCESYPVFYIPTFDKFHKTKSLVWDKTRVGLGHIFRHQHELIIWGRYQDSVYIDDHHLRADVLKFPATLSSDRDHPVEKPEALLMELIEPTTPPGGVVCDLFAGSGTSLSAAKKTGRQFIGFELDPEWHKVAERRVRGANEQTRFEVTA